MNRAINPEYGVSQVYVENIQDVALNVKDNRIDCLGVFVGLERFGKSTLLSITARIFADAFNTKIEFKKVYYYELDQFVQALMRPKYPDNNNAKTPRKGGVHYIKVYDEPVLGANARKWASEGNTVLNTTLAVIGYKYHVMLMGIPNWWTLDNLVREHRTAFLCRVRGSVDEQTGYIQKGFFDLYNRKQLHKIHRDEKSKETVYPQTKFSNLRFNSLEGTDFWREYEKFSPEAKEYAIDDLLERARALRPKDKPLSSAETEEVISGEPAA